MPTKRKSTSSSKAEPASKKRSTRTAPTTAAGASSDLEVDAAPAKDTTGASSSKAKGKGKAASSAAPKKSKKAAKVVELSDSSDSDSGSSDVVIQPKKSKKPLKSKTSTKMKSKAARAAYSPVEGSTSTPAESTSSTAAGKKSRPAKTASFEVAFPDWFAQFEEAGEKGKMGGEGIEKLFGEMDLSMEGAHPFILAWKVNAKPGSFGSFYSKDFEPVFRAQGIDSSDKLKSFLVKSEKSVMTPHESAVEAKTSPDALAFRQFYTFLFPFLRPEGAKTVPAEMAIAMWSVILAPKFELAKRFVEYATEQGDKFKAVSIDLWTQLHEFCEAVEPDLSGWSEDAAWPSAIDSFVEWKKEKDAAS